MKRTISRSYVLTEKEVREALMLWLKERDLPAPPDEKFSVLNDGTSIGDLEIEWTENHTVGDEP